MTKTLTEKRWFYTENGIKDASWNIVFKSEVLAPVPSYEEYNELLRHSELSRNLVYEVLVNQKEYNELLDKAKEYKRLQEQLEIATKALKEYADRSNWYETDDFGISAVDQFACDDYGYNIAEKALKEMEGVK